MSDLQSKCLYSARMQEITDQKNSEYGYFLRSICCFQLKTIYFVLKHIDYHCMDNCGEIIGPSNLK